MKIKIIGSIFVIYIVHHAIITLTFKNSNEEKRKREKLENRIYGIPLQLPKSQPREAE